MFRSSAFVVRLADVTNTCSLSWTTALAWSTAPGASPGGVARVDGTWIGVDVWTPGTRPVPLEVRGEADGDRVGCRRIAMPEFDAG